MEQLLCARLLEISPPDSRPWSPMLNIYGANQWLSSSMTQCSLYLIISDVAKIVSLSLENEWSAYVSEIIITDAVWNYLSPIIWDKNFPTTHSRKVQSSY